MPTYYVDATTGDDGDDGLSEENAWQTFAPVNGGSFNPGDWIRLKRGEVWVAGLAPPTNGADGNPITFGAYGSGALPIIDAADTWDPALNLAVDWVTVENIEFATDDGFHHATRFRGANYCILQDCVVSNAGNTCVYVTDDGGVTTTHNTIRRNTLYNAVAEGVYVKNETAADGTSDTLVEDNTIYACGSELIQNSYGAPATTAPSGTIMRGNIGTDHSGMGFTDLGGDVLCEKNSFTGTGAGSYGGLYYGSGSGAIIRNNLIYNVTFDAATTRAGIFLNNPDNMECYHNTVYGVSNVGVGVGHGIFVNQVTSGLDISNNIISGCDNQMDWNNAPDTCDHNCVHGTTWKTGTNAITDDPLFVTPGADFHLQSDSPCNNAGVNVGVTDDYDGVTRGDPPDIGAYEYVALGPTIPVAMAHYRRRRLR